MAWRKLPLILQAENSQTSSGPMHKLIVTAQTLEQSGKAEAVSIFRAAMDGYRRNGLRCRLRHERR